MKIFLSLFSSLFILCSCHSTPKTESVAATDSIVNNVDTGLIYLLQEPTVKTENPPLFVLMHGFGSNERDLWDLRGFFPPNFMIVSLRAPITLQEGAYEWYENTPNGADSSQLDKSETLVWEFLHRLQSKNKYDSTHIFLGGFSQGANMSYALGLLNPKAIKGIAVFSGKILPSIYSETKNTQSFAPISAFVGHGIQDDRIAYKDAQSSVKYAQSKGAKIDFHSYDAMYHQISDQELQDFQKWLKVQQ